MKLTNVFISPLSSSAEGETADQSTSEATVGGSSVPLGSDDNASHSRYPESVD